MSTWRKSLENVDRQLSTNAGLWLDKFIRDLVREEIQSRRDLVREVAGIQVPEVYRPWFQRWKKALRDYGAELRVAKTKGRLAIGLGTESVLETSITLNLTYGVPYIPGSALKGLAAAFARQHLGEEWREGTPAYKTVFGDIESAGYVVFFDALPLPDSFSLHPDVIAVHHREYYQGKPSPPADWDSPNPVPCLSATGSFLLALAGPSEWVERAFEILEGALVHLGVGAKTSSGYGRMELLPLPEEKKA